MTGEPASETLRADTPTLGPHGGVQFTITFERKLTEKQQLDIKMHVTHMVDYMEKYYDGKNNGVEVPPKWEWNPEMEFK